MRSFNVVVKYTTACGAMTADFTIEALNESEAAELGKQRVYGAELIYEVTAVPSRVEESPPASP